MTVLEHPQSVQAIFFDAGFTLLAPHPSVPELVTSICASAGVGVDPACLTARLDEAERVLMAEWKVQPDLWSDNTAIRRVWELYFTSLMKRCLSELPKARFIEILTRVVDGYEHAGSYALYPDVEPVLAVLRAHQLKLGIISDWGVHLGLIMRHHDLVPYFDISVISAAVRRAKPDPALFREALMRADVIPDYAVHIGDSYLLDILGAKAAGITGILLDRSNRYEGVALDCPVVRDLYGLLDLLEISS